METSFLRQSVNTPVKKLRDAQEPNTAESEQPQVKSRIDDIDAEDFFSNFHSLMNVVENQEEEEIEEKILTRKLLYGDNRIIFEDSHSSMKKKQRQFKPIALSEITLFQIQAQTSKVTQEPLKMEVQEVDQKEKNEKHEAPKNEGARQVIEGVFEEAVTTPKAVVNSLEREERLGRAARKPSVEDQEA